MSVLAAMKSHAAMRRPLTWRLAEKKSFVPRCLKLPETWSNTPNATLMTTFVSLDTPCLIGEHINSLTAQKIASRAYDAVIDYEFGKRGNVQSFLPRAQSLHRHATAKKSAKSFYPKDGITANSGNFKA